MSSFPLANVNKIEDGSLVMQEEDASKSRKPSVYYRCSYEFYQEFLERNRDGFQETEWLLDLNENNYSQYIDKLKANGALYLYIPRPVGKSIERPETDKDYVFIPYGFMTIAFAGVSLVSAEARKTALSPSVLKVGSE